MSDGTEEYDPVVAAGRQWQDLGWDDADRMVAAGSILRAAQTLVTVMDAALAPLALNETRYRTLLALYFAKHGRLQLRWLSERLQLHQTTVTNSVDRLEKLGYVQRVPHPSDRRTTYAAITERGSAAVEEASQYLVKEGFGLAAMSDDDVSRITTIIGDFRARTGGLARHRRERPKSG